jgi:hypothetical protein
MKPISSVKKKIKNIMLIMGDMRVMGMMHLMKAQRSMPTITNINRL